MDKMNSKRNKPTTPTRTGPAREEPPDPKRTFTGGTVMDEDVGEWLSTTEAAAADADERERRKQHSKREKKIEKGYLDTFSRTLSEYFRNDYFICENGGKIN
eukprot:scaffold95346_cov32-Cyclotella_meneghiniana.AAC.2